MHILDKHIGMTDIKFITWVSDLYINDTISFLPVHIHCLLCLIYCVLKGLERYSKV